MSDKSQQPGNDGNPATPQESNDLVAELKKNLEQYRLSPALKAEILASMPTTEEREREFREMQATGGISSAQFLESLGIENEPKL